MKQEKIKVFKLGGAFFKVEIIKKFFNFSSEQLKNPESKTLFIVSAIAGITRLLDTIYFVQEQKDIGEEYKKEVTNLALKKFLEIHFSLIDKLFYRYIKVNAMKNDFLMLYQWLRSTTEEKNINEEYHAKLQKFGELASSQILSRYLEHIGIKNLLFNAGDYIVTKVMDDNFTKANFAYIKPFDDLFNGCNVLITQGFIAKTELKKDTTMGYDSSDTSAAIFASEFKNHNFEIQEPNFFKNVKGVYLHDPKDNKDESPQSLITYGQSLTILEKTGSFPVSKEALIILQEAGITSCIRSYIDLKHPGTKIVP